MAGRRFESLPFPVSIFRIVEAFNKLAAPAKLEATA